MSTLKGMLLAAGLLAAVLIYSDTHPPVHEAQALGCVRSTSVVARDVELEGLAVEIDEVIAENGLWLLEAITPYSETYNNIVYHVAIVTFCVND